MALANPRLERGKLLVLVGALVATYVLFAAAAMRVALRAREVQVPDLVNRTANEATAIAADLGLAVSVDDTRRPDPKIAAGRVLAQDPPPGTISRAAAQRPRLAERRPARRDRARTDRRDRADGADAADAGRPRRSPRCPRSAPTTYALRRRRGAGPAAEHARAAQVALLVNRGEQAPAT